jgi:transcriptional regulator with XRE-family HTH domain
MLSPIKTNIAEKLKNKGYRTRFFRGRTQDEIAFTLRAARKKRKLTQPELEKLSGMKQSAISRIEQASYSRWNFKTLLRLAESLDLRVRVVFDYAEDVIKEYERREGVEQIHPYETQSIHGQTALEDQSIESIFLPIETPMILQTGNNYTTTVRGYTSEERVHA